MNVDRKQSWELESRTPLHDLCSEIDGPFDLQNITFYSLKTYKCIDSEERFSAL